MSEKPGAVEQQPALSASQPKPRKSTSGRRLFQIGCLPFTFLLVGCLVLFVNLGLFPQAPSWVSDPDEYLLGQRIAGSLGLLMGLQVIGTWLLGLVAAGTAAAAAAGQGAMLYQRLTILCRKVRVVAAAVYMLRLIFLAALAISAVLGYLYLTDAGLASRQIRNLHIMEVAALVSVAAVLLIHWLVGPFLRLRYSMALGAWGASWTHRRHRRVWMALTARMGAGMCGSLALLWGSVLAVLVITTIREPSSRNPPLDLRQAFFPFLPRDSWEGIVFLWGLSALVVLYMVGQLALPPVYLWMARRRLASRTRTDAPERFADRLPELVEAPPAPQT